MTVTTHYGETVPSAEKVTVKVGTATCTVTLSAGKGTCTIAKSALGVGTYAVLGQLRRRHQPECIECLVCH